MNCFEALSAQDLINIKNYIESYAGSDSTEVTLEASLEHLLRFWNENKMDLFHMFGEKLILEQEVSIKKPYNILKNEMNCAVYEGDLTFVRAFNDWVLQFIDEGWQNYRKVTNLVSLDSLLSNSYNGTFFTLPNPKSSHPIQIQPGAKIMRILSKIADAYNLPGFEEFRVAHSMVLNQRWFKGTVCLSIHPLDYMTMSDNDCNWTSCMSWTQLGTNGAGSEYRMGTVECMNSPYIVVAYMKCEKDMEFYAWWTKKKIIWNNKRWRKLFIVTPDLLAGIKGYPFDEEILDNIYLNWLKGMAPYTYLEDKYPVSRNYYTADKLNQIYANVRFNIMYNDFYSDHISYISQRLLDGDCDFFNKILPGQTECMICGEDITDISDEINASFLNCPNCNGLVRCPECGCFVKKEDLVTLNDGTCMCPDCVNEYTYTCPACGEVARYEYSRAVFLRHLGKEEGETAICDNCFDCKSYESELGPVEETKEDSGYWWDFIRTKRYVDSRNCTKKGFTWFGYFGYSLDKIQEEAERDALLTEHFDENGNPL